MHKSATTNKTILRLLFDADFGTTVGLETQKGIMKSQTNAILVLKDQIGDWVRKNG